MAMWTGLGDNTELFWAVLSQPESLLALASVATKYATMPEGLLV
jgi:hypothetical protein